MAISYLRNAECYALNGEAPIRVLCSSTDEKPIEGIPANSTLQEMDTGKKYYFTGTEWSEMSAE